MLPATPPAAFPVTMRTSPDSPAFVVPVLRARTPLDPTETELAVRIVMNPLEDDEPAPLTILTTPPTPPLDVVSPARMATSPPLLLSADPTEILTEPDELPTPTPEKITTSPTSPNDALPDAIVTVPDTPEAVVPLLKTKDPLEPTETAFAE